jgi:hypothetical protein
MSLRANFTQKSSISSKLLKAMEGVARTFEKCRSLDQQQQKWIWTRRLNINFNLWGACDMSLFLANARLTYLTALAESMQAVRSAHTSK